MDRHEKIVYVEFSTSDLGVTKSFFTEVSQRQLQSHLNDNYTYRLTTTTQAVSSGFVSGDVVGRSPLPFSP
jgi:hypothetical protein